MKFIRIETDPLLVIRRLFEQSDVFSALVVLKRIKYFEEKDLVKAMVEVKKDVGNDLETFCLRSKLFLMLNTPHIKDQMAIQLQAIIMRIVNDHLYSQEE